MPTCQRKAASPWYQVCYASPSLTRTRWQRGRALGHQRPACDHSRRWQSCHQTCRRHHCAQRPYNPHLATTALGRWCRPVCMQSGSTVVSLMDEVTYVGGDASKDNLRFTSRFDGCLKVGVVPSIDFAISFDERRVGMHRDHFSGKRSIGACVRSRQRQN